MPVDVVERDDSFEVRAAVPGVKPEDVEVTVQGERVTVRAEARPEPERTGDNWLMREQRYGTIQRSITLPSPVSSEHAEARIEFGVLALRLPKVQGATPRRIVVAASGAQSASPTPNVSSAAWVRYRRQRRAWRARPHRARRQGHRGVSGVLPRQRSAILDT